MISVHSLNLLKLLKFQYKQFFNLQYKFVLHVFMWSFNSECADQLHHCLVRELEGSRPQDPPADMNTAAKIIGAPLPSILDNFLARCSSKANSIVKDPTHPSHSLFQLLPSGRRYQSIRARSASLLNSISPQAVRARPWTQLTPPLSETPYKPSTSWNIDHLTPAPPPPPPTLPNHRKK